MAANCQSLVYVYGRETRADADIAHVLTMDEARRIASNIAKLLPHVSPRVFWRGVYLDLSGRLIGSR